MRRDLIIYVFLTAVVVMFFQGREVKITPRKANDLYQKANYYEALEYYKYLLKADENNIEYNFRIGVCYLNTNIDKSLAIPYFKAVIDLDALDQKTDYAIARYLLGRAQHYGYKFHQAIESLETFLELEGITEEDKEYAKQKIQFCYNAIEFMKFPVDVTFENLGKNVNSEYPDYYPHIPIDESFLLFNSKRDNFSEPLYDGSFASNVYISEVKNSEFKKARLLKGSVNTKEFNEAVIGMSASGDEAMFFIDNGDRMVDLFIGELDKGEVDRLKIMEGKYYSNEVEIAACINADGDVMYIASNREGGYGGVDLYQAKKLPNGKWGELMNLGPEINTPFDDVFPNISEDEKTLYFSSEGHSSMGGLDIFRAEYDPSQRKWTSIKNIGYPINTPEDDINFRISANGKYGYISALRAGGFGDLDIYRVNFNSVEPRYTVISGKLYTVNTNQLIDDVFIEVTKAESGDIYGQYTPNSLSGKYIIILPPGSYKLHVQVEGYLEVEEDVVIHDKSDYQTFINQDLVLKPKDILIKLPHLVEE